MSQTSLLIERAERFSQKIRPATLIYNRTEFPCTPGNLDFFERLVSGHGGGGFRTFRNLHVKILRADIPENVEFKMGAQVIVRDETTKKTRQLIVGESNSEQTDLIILNLQDASA